MPRKRRQKTGRDRQTGGSHALWWVASAVLLGTMGWFFWKTAQTRQTTAVANRASRAPTQEAPSNPPASPIWPWLPLPGATPSNPAALHTAARAAAVTNDPKSALEETNRAPASTVSKEAEKIPAADETGRPARNLLEAQVALARQGISSGPIDGVAGSQTRAAIRVFQHREKLPVTGALDAATKNRLVLTGPVLTNYTVTPDDLDRLMAVPKTWLGKSEQSRLDFETLLELVAEKSHAHPEFIRRLNPEIAWNSRVPAGTVAQVPAVEYPDVKTKANYVRISLSGKTLEAFDEQDRLLAHFPCSIAQKMEKRPVGQLHIVKVIGNPNYVFNPEVFPESAEGRELGRKLVLPPGPNNPVGVAWIGLDRPGYGIHGTPKPEEVGRTESHGCFRLANWNAEFLAQLVAVGTPVFVEP